MSSDDRHEAERRRQRWLERGEVGEISGRRVFYVDLGPRDDAAVVLLHGFPSCSYDYHRVIDELAAERRVIVHDHPGFGASDKSASGPYSLLDQATVAHDLWLRLGVTRAHLVAHDYGTSVATELLARRDLGELDLELGTVTLANGSIYLEMAHLLLTQRLLRHPVTGPLMARWTGRRFFKARMRGLWADRDRVDEIDLEVLWLELIESNGRAVLPKLSGYLDERVLHRDRWVGALARLDLPALVLWGQDDPIAVEAIGRRLEQEIPDATSIWLDGVGHYPMLEAPERWVAALLGFLASPIGTKRDQSEVLR